MCQVCAENIQSYFRFARQKGKMAKSLVLVKVAGLSGPQHHRIIRPEDRKRLRTKRRQSGMLSDTSRKIHRIFQDHRIIRSTGLSGPHIHRNIRPGERKRLRTGRPRSGLLTVSSRIIVRIFHDSRIIRPTGLSGP